MSERVLPAPLLSAEIDIAKLDGFLLDTVRLLSSELVALSTGDEFKAAVLLWCRAWKQTPACSLPNDDRILASFAMVPMHRWRKIKAMALRGFIECSDGRLYHRVLAADALRAWQALESRRDRTRAATEARIKSMRVGRRDNRDDGRGGQRNETPSERNGEELLKESEQQPPHSLPRADARATASSSPQGRAAHPPAELIELFDRLCREYWPESHRHLPAPTDLVTAENWLKSGADGSLIESVGRAVFGRRVAKGRPCPAAMGFLSGAIADALGERSGAHAVAPALLGPYRNRFEAMTGLAPETLERLKRVNIDEGSPS